MPTSPRFSCPGCDKTYFWSMKSAEIHFILQSHSLRCPRCHRVFNDAMAVIQHYQISKCAPKSTQRMSSPTLSSRDVLDSPPQAVDRSFDRGRDFSNDHELSSLLSPVSLTGVNESSIPATVPNLPGSWTILEPAEHNNILRNLHSKCHSQSRLQTQNYVLRADLRRYNQYALKGSILPHQFQQIPSRSYQARPPCKAIAIDCEMVGINRNRQALAFLSAIDFLTGKTLINHYVTPSEDVVDWRSRFSGITKYAMTTAQRSGAALASWQEARDKLWEFMDDSTILVGQSLNFDLEVLGMCHAKIVDTAILTTEAVFPSTLSTQRLPRLWSLKSLTKELLGLEIQGSNRGDDALEDAYAARDIAIWCIKNPEELRTWAEKARGGKERKHARRQNYSKGRSKSNASVSHVTESWKYDSEYEDDYDEFRWSDPAEDVGRWYGYDSWSAVFEI